MNKIQRKIIMLNDAQRLALLLDIAGIMAGRFPLTNKGFEDLVDEHLTGQTTYEEGGK